MRKTRTAFFSILLVVSLIIFQMPAAADEATLPKPLTPRLSADGNTLYDGGSLLAVVVDSNPSTLRRIPAPAGVSDQPEEATASFSITYIPNGGTDKFGEPCYTFPEEAKTAFNAAANVWANILTSTVPITINACWADLSGSTLGYSGGGPLHGNFTGATRPYTWYSGSLANALNGSDLDPSRFDMHITYNRNYTWYYGTDGNTPLTQMDLMTVVLHEICHGLNFSGSMDYSGGSGSWGYGTGYPNIYDVFMRDGSGTQLIDTGSYPNGSTALGGALTSNDMWFHGTQAMAANGNQRVKMYAPSTWSSGTSYSHLDYNTFNNTSNQLMVYSVSAGESIHDPGVITKGLLEDLGWQSSSLNLDIKANASDGPVTVPSGTPVSVTVGLDPGGYAGFNADWWIAASTPFDPPGDWYTYIFPAGWFPGINLYAQTELFDLSTFEVLNMVLPPGEYTFYFGIDDPDGVATGPWWGLDWVEVNVE